MSALVEMKGVVKKFPGVTALKDITFDIQPGEVHVLLGENGAGKSTLMKILSGVYQPTEGEIIVGGKSYKRLTPKDSAENGISVIYQELSVINELSIQENLFVGKLPMKKYGPVKVVDYKYMNERAKELLSKVGLKRDPKTLVEDISISEKQQVEIAKALAADSKVIIMDEPTASLTSEEVNHLFKIVRQLKEEGKGIVFISHKLGEIIEIGDRVSVLKDGAYVGTRDVKGVTADDLVTMMVGRKIQNTYQHEDAPDTYENTEVIFEVRNLSRKDQKVKNVSFKLHKGEILGFSGLHPFIITLGTQAIYRGVTLIISNSSAVYGFPASFTRVISKSVIGIPLVAIIAVIVALILAYLTKKTKLGRNIYALGGNKESAWYSGINVNLHTLIVFIISGICAGIAGVVLLGRVGSAEPAAATGFETYAIAASIIGGTSFFGGKGKIFGVVMGGLIIGVINFGMNILSLSSTLQQVVMGALIIGSVALDRFVANKK